MIQRIERLGANLDLVVADERHGLPNAEIEVPRRRIALHVSRLDPEGARRRLGKRQRIEPRRRGGERPALDVGIPDKIPELTPATDTDASKIIVAADGE